MELNHSVPSDWVKLTGFTRIVHSPVSDIFLSTDTFELVCKPNEILGLKPDFPKKYNTYGVLCTTHRNCDPPKPYTFEFKGTTLELLDSLLKELSDDTNLYLFGYTKSSDHIVSLPDLPLYCPTPPEAQVRGLQSKLIAVICKK